MIPSPQALSYGIRLSMANVVAKPLEVGGPEKGEQSSTTEHANTVPTMLPEYKCDETFPKTFPRKLWEAVGNSRSTLMSWDEHGTKILVNSDRFENEVMTSHPELMQIPSFLNFRRQLREYNFNWANLSDGDFEFSHPLFIRNREDLVKNVMTRRKERSVYKSLAEEIDIKTEEKPKPKKRRSRSKNSTDIDLNSSGKVYTIERRGNPSTNVVAVQTSATSLSPKPKNVKSKPVRKGGPRYRDAPILQLDEGENYHLLAHKGMIPDSVMPYNMYYPHAQYPGLLPYQGGSGDPGVSYGQTKPVYKSAMPIQSITDSSGNMTGYVRSNQQTIPAAYGGPDYPSPYQYSYQPNQFGSLPSFNHPMLPGSAGSNTTNGNWVPYGGPSLPNLTRLPSCIQPAASIPNSEVSVIEGDNYPASRTPSDSNLETNRTVVTENNSLSSGQNYIPVMYAWLPAGTSESTSSTHQEHQETTATAVATESYGEVVTADEAIPVHDNIAKDCAEILDITAFEEKPSVIKCEDTITEVVNLPSPVVVVENDLDTQ